MACRFTELIVDARDPERQVRFWAEVLGWERGEYGDDPHWLKPPSSATPLIVFVPVPEPKTLKNRLHIDVSPTDRSRDEEVERLLALGATRADVGQGDDVSWVVLADPEGNEFCVLGSQVPADPSKWPWPGMD
jgi:catechol 2,3-dioxygenase-like lactoylglutathione lyase family enzyme